MLLGIDVLGRDVFGVWRCAGQRPIGVCRHQSIGGLALWLRKRDGWHFRFGASWRDFGVKFSRRRVLPGWWLSGRGQVVGEDMGLCSL